MALQRQTIAVEFGQGINQAVDAQAQLPGQAVDVRNARYHVRHGRYDQRDGFQAMDTTTPGWAKKVAAYGLEALAIGDQARESSKFSRLYGLANGWSDKGVVALPAIRGGRYHMSDPTTAASIGEYNALSESGVTLVVTTNSTGSVATWAVVDNTTGEFAVAPTSLGITLQHVTLVSFGDGKIYWGGIDGLNNLVYIFKYTVAAQTLASATTFASTGAAANFWFDMIGYTVSGIQYLTVASCATATTTISLTRVRLSNLATTSTTVAAAGTVNAMALATPVSAPTSLLLMWDDTTNGWRRSILATDLSTSSVGTINNDVALPRKRLTAVEESATGWHCFAAVEDVAGTAKFTTKYALANTIGTVTRTGSRVGVSIESRAYLYNGAPMILGVYRETDVADPITSYPLQGACFPLGVYANGGSAYLLPLGRIWSTWIAVPASANLKYTQPSNLYLYSSTALRTLTLTYSGASVNAWTQPAWVELDMQPRNGWQSAGALGRGLLSGAHLMHYDGESVVEAGFLLYPELISTSTAGGGSLSAGSYQVQAWYRWTDAKGILHESPASNILTKVVLANDKLLVGVKCLTLTRKATTETPNAREDVKVVVYRTAVNGSTFYEDTIATNSAQAHSVTVTLSMADSALISRPLAPNTGELLDKWTHDGPRCMTANATRVTVDDPTLPGVTRKSLPFVQGEAIAFDPDYEKNTGLGDWITALASLDDKTIAFSRNGIAAQIGDGPNEAGTQDTSSDFQRLPYVVGAADQNSAVFTPEGIVFKSATAGFWLLDRSLQVQWIGGPVRDYNTATVYASVMVSRTNTARFLLSDGTSLSWDWVENKWDIDDGFAFEHAAVLDDDTCFAAAIFGATPTGRIYKEAPGYYADDHNGTKYGITVKTGYYSFAGLQGFQRLDRVFILGHFLATHDLVVTLDYDFEGLWTEVHTLTITSGAPYQFELAPLRAKCQSMALKIVQNPTSSSGAGSLSGLSFKVGVIPGGARIATAKRFA